MLVSLITLKQLIMCERKEGRTTSVYEGIYKLLSNGTQGVLEKQTTHVSKEGEFSR